MDLDYSFTITSHGGLRCGALVGPLPPPSFDYVKYGFALLLVLCPRPPCGFFVLSLSRPMGYNPWFSRFSVW